MRYVRQFTIIVIISFIGEILNRIIPLPIPASIYGLILMFACLKLKVFPVSKVKETSSFLIEVMPIMFVTPSVSIILAVDSIKNYWWQICLISIITTIAVFGVTGTVTQTIMKLKNRKNKTTKTPYIIEEKNQKQQKEAE